MKENTSIFDESKKNNDDIIKSENNTNTNNKNKIWIRGPYKKKQKLFEKINFEDQCFPFTSGKGILKKK